MFLTGSRNENLLRGSFKYVTGRGWMPATVIDGTPPETQGESIDWLINSPSCFFYNELIDHKAHEYFPNFRYITGTYNGNRRSVQVGGGTSPIMHDGVGLIYGRDLDSNTFMITPSQMERTGWLLKNAVDSQAGSALRFSTTAVPAQDNDVTNSSFVTDDIKLEPGSSSQLGYNFDMVIARSFQFAINTHNINLIPSNDSNNRIEIYMPFYNSCCWHSQAGDPFYISDVLNAPSPNSSYSYDEFVAALGSMRKNTDMTTNWHYIRSGNDLTLLITAYFRYIAPRGCPYYGPRLYTPMLMFTSTADVWFDLNGGGGSISLDYAESLEICLSNPN